jgi:pantoate--beta-alanine ligase
MLKAQEKYFVMYQLYTASIFVLRAKLDLVVRFLRFPNQYGKLYRSNMLQQIATLAELRAFRSNVRSPEKLALVPTMGNLHDGHIALIKLAKQHATHVIASIFVNPSQFGPNEDFGAYPRTLVADCVALEQAGCDAVFVPSVALMYPGLAQSTALAGQSEATSVNVQGISEILCGAVRPGHFRGVATVVAKLFNLVQPDVAIFGQKDFQQLLVIKTMARDLNFPVEIIAANTEREPNGLARSSRNQYLSANERETARVIYATLLQMRHSFEAGMGRMEIEQQAQHSLQQQGLAPDYATIRDAQTLDFTHENSTSWVALIAARLGKTRLIDNLAWSVKPV